MATFLEECEDAFHTKDLYAILDVNKKASTKELKKAYYKMSLKVHPDKVAAGDKKEAADKFKLLCKIHLVLSNGKKRKIYDKTGEVEDDDEWLSNDTTFEDYWRALFPVVTVDDIREFENTYRGSEEEIADIKAAYTKYKGDMQKIINSVMCSTYEDEERFRSIITPLLETGELTTYKKFVQESPASRNERQSKAKNEAKEAEKIMKERTDGSMGALMKAVQKNRQNRTGIIEVLEAKYSNMEHTEPDLVVKSRAKRTAAKRKEPTKRQRRS